MLNQTALPTVLIAGGAGYIGSHTAKVLAAAGFLPVVLDNLCTGNRVAARFGPFYEGSISDSRLVRRIIAEHRPVCAILFAAHAYVGESTVHPRKYFNNNVAASVQFLDAMGDAGLERVVFSSSCAVYGIQSVIPIKESSLADPLSPYAETKLFFEKILRRYDRAYGLRYACLRYFNAAGADPNGELGESHHPETHLIPLAIEAAVCQKSLRVFGTDYPTEDGTAVRDYTHVMDLADGHLRAVQYLIGGEESITLNLGAGIGTSVKQVIQAVESRCRRPIQLELLPRREGDAPVLIADSSFAREVLGWVPQFSSLESVITTAWNWHTHSKALKQFA
jgi:UDP-arabinose 4-epimerase